ncbi:hypothetical protein NEAUS07_2529, partial [Nematocida ausubeli]
LSLCSLVLYNKPIISQYDISHSNISVIYNHIVYWSNNHTVIDIDIINTVIYYCISQYTTESQRLVAYHTVILLLRYTRYNINIFTYIYNRVHIYIQEHKEYNDILSIWQDIQDIHSTGINMTNNNTDINMTNNNTDITMTNNSIIQQDTSKLQTKREEVMRMLMETGKKKEKKEEGDKKGKRVKREKKEESEIKKKVKMSEREEKEEKEEKEPVLIKKASHTVVSSDEDE